MTSPRARIAKLAKDIEALRARQLAAVEQASGLDRFAEWHGREFEWCRAHLLDRANRPKRYWAGQAAIMQALATHRRVAARSAHKTGKSEVLADIIIAMLQTGPTIVVSTAAGARQVEVGLWARINAQHRRSRVPLLGECLNTKLTIAPDWFGHGYSTNNPTSFQGAHSGIEFPDDFDGEPADTGTVVEAIERATYEVSRKSSVKRLLMAFDESPGVDEQIHRAAAGSLLGSAVYAIHAGNPTLEYESDHAFARAFHPGSGYYRIKLTAPDDDQEPDPIESDESFVVPSFIATREDYDKQFPPGNPDRGPRMFGRFRDGDVSGKCITFAMLRAAAIPTDRCLKRGPHIGCDTAGDGADANVATLYVDSVKLSRDSWHSQDTIATWERLRRLRDHWQAQIGREIPWRNVHVDAAPIAKGLLDYAARQGCHLDCVDFGGGATNAWRDLTGDVSYKNRRAELHWVARELLRTGRACIPEQYRESWRDLTAAGYDYNLKGELVIEPKDEIKKRLGRSPDDGDADLLALAAIAPSATVRKIARV